MEKATYFAIWLVFFRNLPFVRPTQHSSKDPFSDFNNDMFGSDFDEMDKSERFHEEIEARVGKWEDRCLEVGGQNALDMWLKAQENLVFCVMRHFNVQQIQSEIEEKKQNGDLDLVFEKYCGEPVQKTRPCVEDFLLASRRCLRRKDQQGLYNTMKMIDTAIDFMCHNRGDRMALFMSEDGINCVETHREELVRCFDLGMPKHSNKLDHSNYIDFIVFNHENCRKINTLRDCVETALMKCDDPTPSNVVSSMLLSMRNATPCRRLSASYTSASVPVAKFFALSHAITLFCPIMYYTTLF